MSATPFLVDTSSLAALLPALRASARPGTGYAILREILTVLPTLPRQPADEQAEPGEHAASGIDTGDGTVGIVWVVGEGQDEVTITGWWIDGVPTTATAARGEVVWSLLEQDGEEARLEPEGVVGPRQARELEEVEARFREGMETARRSAEQAEWCPRCGGSVGEDGGCVHCGGMAMLPEEDYYERVLRRAERRAVLPELDEAPEITLTPEFADDFRELLSLLGGAVEEEIRSGAETGQSAKTKAPPKPDKSRAPRKGSSRAKTPATCRECGREQREGARFCDHCGAVQETSTEAAAPPPAERPTRSISRAAPSRYADLVLTGLDPAKKIQVIKAVRELRVERGEKPDGLDHIKRAVEKPPFVVCGAVPASELQPLVRRLEEAGAVIEVRRRS